VGPAQRHALRRRPAPGPGERRSPGARVSGLGMHVSLFRYSACPVFALYDKKSGPDAALPPEPGALTRTTNYQMGGQYGVRGLDGVRQQGVCPCPLAIVSPRAW
jgi:hypothetical protein